MASHRKPHQRHRLVRCPAVQRGTVGMVAALASVTLLPQPASAEPDGGRPRLEEVRERVDALYRQAGTATQRYHAAQQRTEAQRDRVERLLRQVARRTEQMNEARRTLGSLAAARYRDGGVSGTAALLLADDPREFFERRHVLQRLTDQQQRAVAEFRTQRRRAAEQRAEAARTLRSLEASQESLRRQKRQVQQKLDAARALLDRLTEQERRRLAELERQRRAEARRKAAERAAQQRREGVDDSRATGRARQAVEFARQQLGKPYVWGATGPNSYDCSGLTQAAWASAGVTLPRTTWDQVNAGMRVARSQLQPGDLVFFYEDISHVGLYIGDGQMIHAPKPGDTVRIEAVDYMPFHSAVRPG